MSERQPPQTSASAPYDQLWTEVYGDMPGQGPTHRHLRRILRTLLHGLEYRSVLDIGCGPGHNFPLLNEGRSLNRVAGADVSSWALQEARRQLPRGEFHQLDIQGDHLSGRWDLVHSSLLLEHLPADEAALHNMRQMAERYLLVSTIGGEFERYRAWEEKVGHVRNYRPGELETKVAAAGFHVERVVRWGYPFYTPLARTLQNRSRFGLSRFGKKERLASNLLYGLYFLNSWKRGDVVVLLARVSP